MLSSSFLLPLWVCDIFDKQTVWICSLKIWKWNSHFYFWMACPHPKELWMKGFNLMTEKYWHTIFNNYDTLFSLKQAQLHYVHNLSIPLKLSHQPIYSGRTVLKLFNDSYFVAKLSRLCSIFMYWFLPRIEPWQQYIWDKICQQTFHHKQYFQTQ